MNDNKKNNKAKKPLPKSIRKYLERRPPLETIVTEWGTMTVLPKEALNHKKGQVKKKAG